MTTRARKAGARKPRRPAVEAITDDERFRIAVAVANLERVVADCLRRDPRAFAHFLVEHAHWDACENGGARHAAIRHTHRYRRIQAARDEVWSALSDALGWQSTRSAEAPGGWVFGSEAHDRDVTRFVLGLLNLPESYIVPAE